MCIVSSRNPKTLDSRSLARLSYDFPSLSALLLAHFTTRGETAARAATPPRSSPMTMTSWPAGAGLRAAVPTAPPTEGTGGLSGTTPRGGETTRPRPAPKKATCPPCRRMRAGAQAKGCASPSPICTPCMGPRLLRETELEMGCVLQIPGWGGGAPLVHILCAGVDLPLLALFGAAF